MKIKLIFYTLILFLFCASCNKNKGQSPKKLNIVEIDTNQQIVDNIDPEIEFYPSKDSIYPLQILQVGEYEQSCIPFSKEKDLWIGLFKRKNNYYLAESSVLFEKTDIVENEQDEDSWVAWNIKTTHQDSVVVLINGLILKENKDVYYVNIEDDIIKPSTPKSFIFNEKKYTLIAEGNCSDSTQFKDELVCSDYQLFLEGSNGEGSIKQLLASSPFFDDAIFRILFVGDIDNDGLPDFIIDTSYKYSFNQPTLYLSSFANKYELVKPIALLTQYGC